MADLPRVRDDAFADLVPFFDMTNNFLNILGPTTWADLFENHQELQDFEDVKAHLVENPAEWMWWGFAVCLALGCVFMLLMPLCGCCFCCCRTFCGCCQEQNKVKRGKSPPSCGKTIICSVLLFVLASTMLVTSLVALAVIPVIQAEFEPETGMLNDVTSSLRDLGKYVNDTFDEVEQDVIEPLNNITQELVQDMGELPESSISRLALQTGVDPALYDLNTYAQSMPNLYTGLIGMDNQGEILETMRSTLDSSLLDARQNISDLLTYCPLDVISECNALENDVHKLVSWARYDNLSDTTSAAEAVKLAVDLDIPVMLQDLVTEYESLSDEIENSISAEIDELESIVDEAFTNIDDTLDEWFKNLILEFPFDQYAQKVEEKVHELNVEEYKGYVFKALLVVAALACVTAVLYLVGLPFGLFCGSCGATHGANCLMASIGFTFIFSFVFWLTTVVFLATGGALYLPVCRHLPTYDESAQALEQFIRSDTYNVTIKEVLDSCQKDEAIYSALHLADNGYNLDDLLDLETTGLIDALEDLTNIDIALPDIDFAVSTLNSSIAPIDAATNAINFEGYMNELSKNETKIDLLEYATRMRHTADMTSNETFASNLEYEATQLETIYGREVVTMGPNRDLLRNATDSSHRIVSSIDLSQTMTDLEEAQTELNDNGEDYMSEIIENEAYLIYYKLGNITEALIYTIEEDIGNCHYVYMALRRLVQGPCVYFLDPWNAMWFSIGWFMSFGILAICIASKVVGAFRSKSVMAKTSPADRSQEYDEYPMVDYK